jgi:hypothetical protein
MWALTKLDTPDSRRPIAGVVEKTWNRGNEHSNNESS